MSNKSMYSRNIPDPMDFVCCTTCMFCNAEKFHPYPTPSILHAGGRYILYNTSGTSSTLFLTPSSSNISSLR